MLPPGMQPPAMTLECERDRLSACLYAHGGAHLPDVPPAVVVLEAARLQARRRHLWTLSAD